MVSKLKSMSTWLKVYIISRHSVNILRQCSDLQFQFEPFRCNFRVGMIPQDKLKNLYKLVLFIYLFINFLLICVCRLLNNHCGCKWAETSLEALELNSIKSKPCSSSTGVQKHFIWVCLNNRDELDISPRSSRTIIPEF